MIYFISHRGNLNGSVPEQENNPGYIQQALDKGFDCEIDVWFHDHKLMLGHDAPQYKIPDNFFIELKSRLWFHAKNLDAFHHLLRRKVHCFWHETDAVTLTSQRYIWTYPGKQILPGAIAVMPDVNDISWWDKNCGGICSDHIAKLKSHYGANRHLYR